MIPDIDIIREAGGTPEKLKAKLSDPPNKSDGKIKKLYDRIQARIQEGVTWNTRNYRLFYALDLGWNAPLRQVSQTLLSSLADKKLDSVAVKKVIEDWGLAHVIAKQNDQKTVDIPYFTHCAIPLSRAYLTMRWAKIVSDRNQYPFLKYEPQHQTPDLRAKCEVVTDRVQVMSQQYDHFSSFRQGVFQMLHYGQCIQFPREAWHSEQQMVRGENGKAEAKYVREGIRYHIPHPTRTYVDQAHPARTINSDSGVEYMGYWTLARYRDICNNKRYWNTDKVTYGAIDWVATYPYFFQNVGQACTLQFPTGQGITNPGILDREKQMSLYTSDQSDQAVLVTNHFERLIPSECGLFDYDYPIWMRFVMANDFSVLYAEPFTYTPGIYYGYDANDNQTLQSSLTLETLPFQDHMTNLMSQYILSVKQNLANLNLLDEDLIGGKDKEEAKNIMERLRNRGEKWFRELNFEWFSSRKARFNSSNTIDRAVHSFRFNQLDTVQIATCMRQLLDLMERTLVMSSQEVAQASSHEQTAEEVRTISQNTSVRLNFTGSAVDQALYAQKKQIYVGLMSFGEPEFYAQLSQPYDQKALEKLGFTVETPWDERYRAMRVKTKDKTAIAMESFASGRPETERIQNGTIATAMSQIMSAVISNERLLNVVGDAQVIELMNLINQYLGLPRDFKLRAANPTLPPMEQVKQMLVQVRQGIMGEVAQGIQPVVKDMVGMQHNIQAIAGETQKNTQGVAAVSALIAQLSKLIEVAAGGPQTMAPTQDDTFQPGIPPQGGPGPSQEMVPIP